MKIFVDKDGFYNPADVYRAFLYHWAHGGYAEWEYETQEIKEECENIEFPRLLWNG